MTVDCHQRLPFVFAHNAFLCNSVTFEFWFTLECLRRHGNLKSKRFDFISNTSQFIGLFSFFITDWTYLVFWKKLALNQLFRCKSLSVYIYTHVSYRVNNYFFLPTDKTNMYIYMYFSLQIFVILGSMDEVYLK